MNNYCSKRFGLVNVLIIQFLIIGFNILEYTHLTGMRLIDKTGLTLPGAIVRNSPYSQRLAFGCHFVTISLLDFLTFRFNQVYLERLLGVFACATQITARFTKLKDPLIFSFFVLLATTKIWSL